jgi:glycosyltransferase involved in cell wall biosynthesis
MKRKILVRGPALSQTGYGEQTRFALRSLAEREDVYDIYLINTTWGKSNWLTSDDAERKWIDSLVRKTASLGKASYADFDLSLQVTIPQEWEKLTKYNIGYTAGVETTKVSKLWLEKGNEMDKIIFVSNFSEEIYNNSLYREESGEQVRNTTSTCAVNYGVREHDLEDICLDLSYDFNFLTIAQWGPRKNLDNTIKWFVEEFKDEEVGLVLKTNLLKNSLIDRRHTLQRLLKVLDQYPDRKCKVHFVHGYLSDSQMKSFYTNPKIKAYVTTTHGEGFGLPIFEAAAQGMPVVAADWSGYCDFMYMPTKNKDKTRKKAMFAKVRHELKEVQKENVWDNVIVEDSKWCYPDGQSFKIKMRQVYEDHGRFVSQARKLQEFLKEDFKESRKLNEFANQCLPPDWIEPEEFESISFCIATNGKKVEKTKQVIEALKNQITTKEIEIVVSGVTMPFEDIEGVKLVDASEKAEEGYLAELRNISGRAATGDIICWLDDDMLFPPGWLWQLESFSMSEGWDVLGNKIHNPDGSRFWDRSLVNPHVLVDYNHPSYDANLYQTGGFWVIRKAVFEDHEWDGSLLIYADKNQNKMNEDIDYSRRLYEAGYQIKFDSDNVIWHWDNNYTTAQVNENPVVFQTLRKSDIDKHMGPQNYPPVCESFKNLLQMIGAE